MAETNKFYLLPGGIFSNKNPFVVDTILGSCVSVFLFDAEQGFGCINHYMLPAGRVTKDRSYKYGDVAIPEVINRMQALGSKRQHIKAKIFGGSNIGDVNDLFSIGDRNLSLARNLLREADIPIISSNVGGDRGRKVIFHTATGEVFIKFINKG